MRKKIIGTPTEASISAGGVWLDLEELAQVELTSEAPLHPIENALNGTGTGWRAAGPGEQTLRLRFDHPRPIGKIRLVFREEEVQRTQEFVLKWAGDGGELREVVRQQFNFSPPQTRLEVEEYRVDLPQVRVLELSITPDKSGENAPAALTEWRLA